MTFLSGFLGISKYLFACLCCAYQYLFANVDHGGICPLLRHVERVDPLATCRLQGLTLIVIFARPVARSAADERIPVEADRADDAVHAVGKVRHGTLLVVDLLRFEKITFNFANDPILVIAIKIRNLLKNKFFTKIWMAKNSPKILDDIFRSTYLT